MTSVASFSSLPSDIISEIVDKQLLNGISEQSFDSDPLPAILLVLPFVSKSARNALRRENSIAYKWKRNFFDLPRYARERASGEMLSDLILRSGSLSLLVWFVEYLKYPLLRPDCLYAALQGGHLPIIEYLLPKDYPLQWSETVRSHIVSSGTIEMVTWAKKHFLELYQPVSLLNAALKKGQLSLAKYICSNEEIESSYWSSYDPASEATKSGNPEVLQFVVDQGASLNNVGLFDYAVNTSLAMIKFLEKNAGFNFRAYVMNNVPLETPMESYEYLYSIGNQLDVELLTNILFMRPNVALLCWIIQKKMKVNAKRLSLFLLQSLTRIKSSISICKHCELLKILSSYENGDVLRSRLNATSFGTVAALPPLYLAKYLATSTDRSYFPHLTRSHLESTSYFALETIRYLIEEMSYEISKKETIDERRLRKDVLEYLRSRNLLGGGE